MNKQFYTGTDAPVSLSITQLSNGYALTLCLCATSTEKEGEETEYEYTMLSGMTDDVSLRGIVRIIYEHDSISLIDDTFKAALAAHYSDYSRSHLISAIIRAKYTSDDVEAIILNHGDGNDAHDTDYESLQQWRKLAKEIAG